MESVCVFENDCISVFSNDGQDYCISLPFPVYNVWCSKWGLLLERQVNVAVVNNNDNNLPTLYSLLHPLDDINPVICKTSQNEGSQAQYISDVNQRIVLCSIDPSIVVFHNATSNTHTIWRVRKATTQENEKVLQNVIENSNGIKPPISALLNNPKQYLYQNNTYDTHTHSHTHTQSFHPSTHTHTHAHTHAHTLSHHRLFSPGTPTHTHSPSAASQYGGRVTVSATPKHQLHTPKNPMAMLSRTQSPSLGTPDTPWHSSLNATTLIDPEPLVPDLCFDLLWTDHSPTRANSAFLTQDAAGQRYLCLVLTQAGVIRCLKYDLRDANSSRAHGDSRTCRDPEREVDARTDRQRNAHTDRQRTAHMGDSYAHTPTDRQRNAHMGESYTHTPTDRQRNAHMDRGFAHMDRQRNAQMGDSYAHTPTDRQRNAHMDRGNTHTDRSFAHTGRGFAHTDAEYAHDDTQTRSQTLVFGSATNIPGRDAQPIKKLDMMVVLEGSSSLSLYSGVSLISRINLCGLPPFNSSLFQDFSSLNISARLYSPSQVTTPRRSTLLTSSRPASAADAKFETILSPVVGERLDGSLAEDPPQNCAIVGLRDPAQTRVTLEHASGALYRISLPDIASSYPVQHCLSALKAILPKDAALYLHNRWYATRNAPGSGDFSPESEWTLFSRTLLSSAGYDTDKLALSGPTETLGDSTSSFGASKKFRASENGSESDWEYLLASSLHAKVGEGLSNILALNKLRVVTESGPSEPGRVDTSSALFPHLPAILTALHLVYEDFKLNILHWDFCLLLVPCLQQLAADLRLPRYLYLYWRDFPSVCTHVPPLQLSAQDTTKLLTPPYIARNQYGAQNQQNSSQYQQNQPHSSQNSAPNQHNSSQNQQNSSQNQQNSSQNQLNNQNSAQNQQNSSLNQQNSSQNQQNHPYTSQNQQNQPYISQNPPDIQKFLYELMGQKPTKKPGTETPNSSGNSQKSGTETQGENLDAYPCLAVCKTTRNLVLLYSLASLSEPPSLRSLKTHINCIDSHISEFESHIMDLAEGGTSSERVVLLMAKLGITVRDIQLLAPGVALPLMNAQHLCRTWPPENWPPEAYNLVQRPDLVAHRKEWPKIDSFSVRIPTQNEKNRPGVQEDDGMELLDEKLLRLRWPEDQRVVEVRRMLASSRPVLIKVAQRPEVSDHDFLEEQERHLYALCVRTMALPVGRGMFTLCTAAPLPTEPLSIPRLNLTGRAPPRGTTIDLSNIEVPPNVEMWPHFHNGVAAGLRVAPDRGRVDSTWIVYNKPRGNLDTPTQHAGFLMALGLNGHLQELTTVSVHDYLTRGHEMICVGLLLGLAACKRGTMDQQITKLLSVHLECLLPPTSTELDVAHTIQVAAILSLGLLYQDTAHCHMSEVLLWEIGRPPGPEMENSSDRESYSLAAGLALGLVMFGRGGETGGLADVGIASHLHHYIEGGRKKPLPPAYKDKYKSPSYQIKEGDLVNIDVTAPGAILALGMIYFNTNNTNVANWIQPPHTPYLLDQVRPDFLLLRTVSLGLIWWDSVMPSCEWVESHIPTSVLTHVHRAGNQSTPGIDYESMHQAYYNILAGGCLVLGLKFAGSANNDAFNVLWKYTSMFNNFTKRSVAELAGRSTLETCLNTSLVALSLVMAGTGDLQVLRIIRHLRSRVGPANSTVGYGSHLVIHMALGFLFLGGGRFTLSTSNMSVAALLIACFPKFPTHSNDNRYHLQALRHLYVLAAEPRLVMPVDVDTGRLCQVKVMVQFESGPNDTQVQYDVMAPTLLPELSKLSSVTLESDTPNHRYWPCTFTRGHTSWQVLAALLRSGAGVAVKLREGRFPYTRLDTTSAPSNLPAPLFTSDPAARWTIKGIRQVSDLSQRAGLQIWQAKLMSRAAHFLHNISNHHTLYTSGGGGGGGVQDGGHWERHHTRPLVSPEQALSLEKRLHSITDEWLMKDNLKGQIRGYLDGHSERPLTPKCAFIMTLLDLPTPLDIQELKKSGNFVPLIRLAVLGLCSIPD